LPHPLRAAQLVLYIVGNFVKLRQLCDTTAGAPAGTRVVASNKNTNDYRERTI
jgi:hypothetical protein